MPLTKEAEKLIRNYKAAAEKLKNYQDNCFHTGHSRKYNSNDGNYDPSADRYWIDCYCELCDKKWTENPTFNYDKKEQHKALKLALKTFETPGIKPKPKKNVADYRADPNNKGRVIRVLNGVETTGVFDSNGVFTEKSTTYKTSL